MENGNLTVIFVIIFVIVILIALGVIPAVFKLKNKLKHVNVEIARSRSDRERRHWKKVRRNLILSAFSITKKKY